VVENGDEDNWKADVVGDLEQFPIFPPHALVGKHTHAHHHYDPPVALQKPRKWMQIGENRDKP
jgi:hypothetical protein